MENSSNMPIVRGKMIVEIFIRGIQHLFASFLFDAPLLSRVKTFILRLFFNLGTNVWVGHGTIFYSPHSKEKAKLEIGNNVSFEHFCDIDYSGGLIVKDGVTVAERVIIYTHGHKLQKKDLSEPKEVTFSPLVIEEGVTIYAGAIILDSVKIIKKGAIIGAGSLVTNDVDEWSVIMGNPARKYFERSNLKNGDTITILGKLNKIFCQVFDDDTINLSPEMIANDIDGWDSLKHVNLILALEYEFSMNFTEEQIAKMRDIRTILDILSSV